jgi:hypothetical protein
LKMSKWAITDYFSQKILKHAIFGRPGGKSPPCSPPDATFNRVQSKNFKAMNM